MKKLILFLLLLLSVTVTLRAEEIVAADTLAYTATRIESEPAPNQQQYVFALWGTTDDVDYKIQINYHATSMYGTFSDDDFDLAGSGKNYNFIRTADGMKVWFFKHLDVTIAELSLGTQIDINGLIDVFGQWRRVLVQGLIPATAPSDTLNIDLGQIAIVPNTFFDYTLIEACNADYSLAFGLPGQSSLEAGTYYRTELLRPDFVRLPSDTISPVDAQLLIADSTVAGLKQLRLDLLSDQNILYRIHMHTDVIAARDTVQITFDEPQLIDLELNYNLFQFVGQDPLYQVAVAVRPEVIHESMLQIPGELIDLSYTRVFDVGSQQIVSIQQASANVVLDADGNGQTLYADLLGTNWTRYLIAMHFQKESALGQIAYSQACRTQKVVRQGQILIQTPLGLYRPDGTEVCQ